MSALRSQTFLQLLTAVLGTKSPFSFLEVRAGNERGVWKVANSNVDREGSCTVPFSRCV